MVIGICNNKEQIGEELKRIIEIIMKNKSEHWDIKDFCCVNDLLKSINKIKIVFLDVETLKTGEIEIGRVIKLINPLCKIIAVGKNAEEVKKSSCMDASEVIANPIKKRQIKKILKKAMEEDGDNQNLKVFFGRREFKIPQQEIYYITAYNGTIQIITSNQTYRRDISLTKVSEMLDENLFYQIHRNCIVNLNYVHSYEKNKVKVEMGELDVSRRRRKEFQERFIQFNLKCRE